MEFHEKPWDFMKTMEFHEKLQKRAKNAPKTHQKRDKNATKTRKNLKKRGKKRLQKSGKNMKIVENEKPPKNVVFSNEKVEPKRDLKHSGVFLKIHLKTMKKT